jgi:hypothetical protein
MRFVIVPSRLKCLDICFTCFFGDWIIAEWLALAFLKLFFSLLQHLESFVPLLALHCRCGPTRFDKDLQNFLFTLDVPFQKLGKFESFMLLLYRLSLFSKQHLQRLDSWAVIGC